MTAMATDHHRANSRLRRVVAVIVLALISAASAASAQIAPVNAEKAAKDGQVWGALVFASDKKPDEVQKAPADFPDLQKRLGKAFAHKHYIVLGEHNQVIFREYESWVVPSKDLFLKLDSRGVAKNGGMNVHVQFWQGQKVLVKTDVVLQPGSPLFIQGPKWRDGHLIFVLLLKNVEVRPGK